MTRLWLFVSLTVFSNLLQCQGRPKQFIDNEELRRLWEFQSSKLKHGPGTFLLKKIVGLSADNGKSKVLGTQQDNIHWHNDDSTVNSVDMPPKILPEYQNFPEAPKWMKYPSSDHYMRLLQEYSHLQAQLSREIVEILNLQRIHHNWGAMMDQKYDDKMIQALIRSLKSLRTTTYNVPREHLLQLRVALLEFLFPRNTFVKNAPVHNTSTTLTLNQTDVNTGSSILAFASGDDTSKITATTTIISDTPTGNNGSVILQTLQDAVLSNSSTQLPIRPANSNLIKLMQVYGDKSDTSSEAANALTNVLLG